MRICLLQVYQRRKRYIVRRLVYVRFDSSAHLAAAVVGASAVPRPTINIALFGLTAVPCVLALSVVLVLLCADPYLLMFVFCLTI